MRSPFAKVCLMGPMVDPRQLIGLECQYNDTKGCKYVITELRPGQDVSKLIIASKKRYTPVQHFFGGTVTTLTIQRDVGVPDDTMV